MYKKHAKDINISMMIITILPAKTAIIKTKVVAKMKNQDLKTIEKKNILLLLLLNLPKNNTKKEYDQQ